MAYIGIPVASMAAFLFGAFWYTGFSRQWLAAIEMDRHDVARRPRPFNPMIASALSQLYLAACLSWVLDRMSVVGWHWGAMCGLIIGVGLILPTIFVNYIFPARKPMLTLLDGGHWICVFTIMGGILGFWSGLDF